MTEFDPKDEYETIELEGRPRGFGVVPTFGAAEELFLDKQYEIKDVDTFLEFAADFNELSTSDSVDTQELSHVVEAPLQEFIDENIPKIEDQIRKFFVDHESVEFADSHSILELVKEYDHFLKPYVRIQNSRFVNDTIDDFITKLKAQMQDLNDQYELKVVEEKWVYISNLLTMIVCPNKTVANITIVSQDSQLTTDQVKIIDEKVEQYLTMDVWLELIKHSRLQPLLLPLVDNDSAYNMFFDAVMETDPANIKKQLESYYMSRNESIKYNIKKLIGFLSCRPDSPEELQQILNDITPFLNEAKQIGLHNDSDVTRFLKIRPIEFWKGITEMSYFDINVIKEIKYLPSNYQVFTTQYEIIEGIIALLNIFFDKITVGSTGEVTQPVAANPPNLTATFTPKESFEKSAEELETTNMFLRHARKMKKQSQNKARETFDNEHKNHMKRMTRERFEAPSEKLMYSIPKEIVEYDNLLFTDKLWDYSLVSVEQLMKEQQDKMKNFDYKSLSYEIIPLSQYKTKHKGMYTSCRKIMFIEAVSGWLTSTDFGKLKPSIEFLYEVIDQILVKGSEGLIRNVRLEAPLNNRVLFSSFAYMCDSVEFQDEGSMEFDNAFPFGVALCNYIKASSEYTLLFPIIKKEIPYCLNTYVKTKDNKPISILEFV